MLSKGPAKKVTIYVNEDVQHHLGSLYESILIFLMHKGISGATATKALAGFGSHQMLHTPNVEALAEHLPIRIEFVESAPKVDELLPTLYDMVTDGLIEVQDTVVVKAARKERKAAPARAHEEKRQPARLMRIFLGEADRWHGEPLYEAIVKRLRMMEIAGATVHRGISGYGAKGREHKQSFLHISRDLPVMIAVIDSAEKIAEAVSAVEEMLEDGLIALSEVEMIRLVRSNPDMERANAGGKPG
jgi:hypothetical protein